MPSLVTPSRSQYLFSALLVLVLAAGPCVAQPEAPAADAAELPAAPVRARLPEARTTPHQITLEDRGLAFAATAGAITVTSTDGRPEADIAYVAYQLETADPAARPVTFVVNGGPGAASAYLQLGVLGPWLLPMDGERHRAVAAGRAGAQPRDLARLHRPRLHRSGRHRVQPAGRARTTGCATATSRSTATSRRSPTSSCAG